MSAIASGGDGTRIMTRDPERTAKWGPGVLARKATRSPGATRNMRDAAILVLCVALSGCAGPGHVAAGDAAARIWDVGAARFIDERQLVTRLVEARYRLLGEVHDNPAHHSIRARLINAIAAAAARPAVVFEQFDVDSDQALSAAQAADPDPERLIEAGRLDRESWQWPLHKPIVDVALAMRLPIRAGNLSRAQLGGNLQAAIDQGATAWSARLRAARWTERQAEDLRAEIIESHCNKLPLPVVPRLALAQRVRDAAMAQALVDAATDDGAILIAGNGHMRTDRGVPVYLHAPGLRDADARSISVGLIEAGPGDRRARDFPRNVIDGHPGFDYVWLTPAVEREDPCNALG
jgi:uncharacterized iron-regulated protein